MIPSITIRDSAEEAEAEEDENVVIMPTQKFIITITKKSQKLTRLVSRQ
jgi:hypothetical protein